MENLIIFFPFDKYSLLKIKYKYDNVWKRPKDEKLNDEILDNFTCSLRKFENLHTVSFLLTKYTWNENHKEKKNIYLAKQQ